MKRVLPHFKIEGFYGGSQDWCQDLWMKMGGCGAVTMCDCCLYLDHYKGTAFYPFDRKKLTRSDYVSFAMQMKPYLRPRIAGINRTELFVKGAQRFLREKQCSEIRLISFSGRHSPEEARQAVIEQIDAGFPIPYLNLLHRDPSFQNYQWHWFLLNGYETHGDRLMVRAVTYGGWRWLDFDALWNTGHPKKGGMVLIRKSE